MDDETEVAGTQRLPCLNGGAAATVTRDGDPVALGELARHYRWSYTDLHRQARAIVGSTETAHDIVQEVFARTTAAMLEREERIEHLPGWLRRCVRNLSLDHLKVQQPLPLNEEAEVLASESLLNAVHARTRYAKVCRAVEEMTPDQRFAFLLADVCGVRYDEIAANLERSVDAVRHLLLRARQQVRTALGPEQLSVAAPAALGAESAASDGRVSSVGHLLSAKVGQLQDAAASLYLRLAELTAQPAGAAVVVLASGAVAVGMFHGVLPADSGPTGQIGDGSAAGAAGDVSAPTPQPRAPTQSRGTPRQDPARARTWRDASPNTRDGAPPGNPPSGAGTDSPGSAEPTGRGADSTEHDAGNTSTAPPDAGANGSGDASTTGSASSPVGPDTCTPYPSSSGASFVVCPAPMPGESSGEEQADLSPDIAQRPAAPDHARPEDLATGAPGGPVARPMRGG